MIRLMIADDHAIMRDGLKKVFVLDGDIEVVAEACDGAVALDRLRETPVDILLLDMTMPGLSGEELIVRLRAHFPKLAILILSMHSEPQIAQRALRAGANGYLTKDRDAETLIAAVRKVASGGRFLDPELAEQIAFDASGLDAQPDHACLTRREFIVLRLLAGGDSGNQIAARLAISNKTVSTHKTRIMEKMGFASNAELVRYAVQHKLVD